MLEIYGLFVKLLNNYLFFSLNGVPACANKKLLTDILRKEWNFTGYVVSDDNALPGIVSHHHYLPSNVEAAAAAIKAGCNLELTNHISDYAFASIPKVCPRRVSLISLYL